MRFPNTNSLVGGNWHRDLGTTFVGKGEVAGLMKSCKKKDIFKFILISSSFSF